MSTKKEAPGDKSVHGNWGDLCHQSLAGLSITATSPTCYVITIEEGFHYEAFDTRAHLQSWNILKLVERVRAVKLFIGEELGVDNFMELVTLNRLLFTAASSVKISDGVYGLTLEKRPVKIVAEMIHLSVVTFTARASVYLPGITHPVTVQETLFVCVDPVSHQPSPPAESWINKYKHMIKQNELGL